MNLERILNGVDFSAAGYISNIDISRISVDSKSIKKGDLFIAVDGHRLDGHDFIDDAIKRGASAVVAERYPGKGLCKAKIVLVKDTRKALPILAANFYDNPSSLIKVIGVTGTNGKTTITYLVESILKSAGCETGVIGTIEYRVGDKSVESKNTTPGQLELQSILRDMADSGASYAVMEISSHGLDQDRIRGIGLDVACFTNITKEHLDYHKTMENYLKAKSRIFGYLKEGGSAVLNADDKRVIGLRRYIKNKVITYGIRERAFIKPCDIRISLGGSSFTVKLNKDKIKVRTRLMGLHNISNILAAVGIASSREEITLAHVQEGIERLKVVPGRLERVSTNAPFSAFVDYAHTDDALSNVLGLLRSVARNNIITVFGCGGDRDTLKRPRMGRVACEMSDKVIITSDNSRSERTGDIISDIVKGIKGKFSNFLIEEERAKAIGKACEIAEKEDIILIAGKGHEKYQIIGDRKIPFDDREVIKRFL